MTHNAPTQHTSSHAHLRHEKEAVLERDEGLDKRFPYAVCIRSMLSTAGLQELLR
jgi:hypothetical protein